MTTRGLQLLSTLHWTAVLEGIGWRIDNVSGVVPNPWVVDSVGEEFRDLQCRDNFNNWKCGSAIHPTLDSTKGSEPASISRTLKLGFSLNLDAIVLPAAPAPTMTKSNVKADEINFHSNDTHKRFILTWIIFRPLASVVGNDRQWFRPPSSFSRRQIIIRVHVLRAKS